MANDPPASRSRLRVRLYRLGEQPPDDLSASTTAEERVAMVWPLTLTAWKLSGRPLPEYRRDQVPIRVVALADLRDRAGT